MSNTEAFERVKGLVENTQASVDTLGALSFGGWLFLIAISILILLNKHFPIVMEWLKQTSRGKSQQLEDYISTPEISDPNTLKVINEIRHAKHFQIATGIYAEQRIRNALIKLHEKTCHKFSWRYIRRASPYLEVSPDEKVSLKNLGAIEKIMYWITQATGYLMATSSALLLIFILISNSKSPASLFLGLFGGTACGILGFLVLLQNWPIQAARIIAKEIESQESSDDPNNA